MEEHVGSMSPTCLLSRFEAHASTAVTPERCSCPLSDAFCVSESGAVLDASFSSAAKTVRRLPSSWTYTRDVEQLQGSVQQSQQQEENIQIRPQSPVECHAVAEASVKVGLEGAAGERLKDHIEECIDHMMRCESLEKRLLCVESENKELRSRLSECSVLHERQCQETKAEYEDDTKRLRSVIQALKIDILQLQTASQEMVQNSRVKDELLKTAQQECRNLQSKLNAFASDLQPCSKVKVASEVAAAEERAALAVQAAEARAIQTKVSAAAEIQRCRSETERLVTELGEAKATINDYMWRCEAMQCSLINARHGLTSASEATAAAERRALADLEAANYRAQEAQAAFEAEIREWREEVARLREALAESNATVDKFIDHSCSLQEELELSQAESLNLFYYSLLRSRSVFDQCAIVAGDEFKSCDLFSSSASTFCCAGCIESVRSKIGASFPYFFFAPNQKNCLHNTKLQFTVTWERSSDRARALPKLLHEHDEHYNAHSFDQRGCINQNESEHDDDEQEWDV